MISRKGKDLSRETGMSPGTRLEEDREQSVLHRLFWKKLPSRRLPGASRPGYPFLLRRHIIAVRARL